MGEAGQGPESSALRKTQEAPRLEKRKGRKAVKGIYYHAAEYQRARQKERNGILRVVSGILEPGIVHIRAFRLWAQARRKGGGSSFVLDNEITRKLLERGKLSDTDVKKFRARSQAHKVFEKYKIDAHTEAAVKAQEVVTAVFSKKGSMSIEEIRELAKTSGLTVSDVYKLAEVARENAGGYQTVDEIKGKFSDEAVLGGLSKEQQKLAKQLWRATWINTALTALNYGKTALIVAFLASTPVGWGTTALITGVSAAVSGITRGTRLWREGKVHDISKSKGIDVSHKVRGLERFLGIDWDEDPAKRGQQYVRAIAAGATIALLGKALPTILEWGHDAVNLGLSEGHNLLDGAHNGINAGGSEWNQLSHSFSPSGSEHVQNAAATFSGKSTEIQFPGVRDGELRIPQGWHFGDIAHNTQNTLFDNNNHGVATFSAEHGQMQFTYDHAYAMSHGIDASHITGTLDPSHIETDNFTSFVNEHSANIQVHNNGYDIHGNPLPHDGPNAPGTEAYGMTDYSDGNSFTIQAYDHLGNQANALTMTVDNQHLVFEPTSYINGHPTWEFTPGDSTHMVTMWQDGHELQVTSGQAADMLHITHGELQNWIHSGNPAGTSSDFDYSVGQNILGHNLLFGHLDKSSGIFQQLGVIRGHSGIGGELTDTKFGENVFDFTTKIGQTVKLPETAPEFHSAIAGPLQTVDNLEDRVLGFFQERVFSDSFTNNLDQLTDFGLHNTDYDAIAFGNLWAERPWYIAGVMLPYVAAGYGGYWYGKRRKEGKAGRPLKWGARAVEVGLLLALPGAAVTAAVGRILAGRARREKQSPKSKPSNNPEVVPGASPTGSIIPSDSSGSSRPPVVPSTQNPSTTPVQSTTAGAGGDDGIAPAPTLQFAQPLPVGDDEDAGVSPLPESVSSAAAISDEERVAPPAPITGEVDATAATDNGQEITRSETVPVSIDKPIDTTNLDVPAITAAVAASDVLKDKPPFDVLQSNASQEEKEAMLKERLQQTGSQKLLETLLAPIAEKLGIPEQELQQRVEKYLGPLEKLEKVGSIILLASRLHQLLTHPAELKELMGKIATAVTSPETKEAMDTAVKNILQSSGEAGAALESLGEEALPAIEEIAPILAA